MDSRPGNLTLGVTFCVESEFQVKNDNCLEPEGKNRKNEIREMYVLLVFYVLCFLMRSWGYMFNFPVVLAGRSRETGEEQHSFRVFFSQQRPTKMIPT